MNENMFRACFIGRWQSSGPFWGRTHDLVEPSEPADHLLRASRCAGIVHEKSSAKARLLGETSISGLRNVTHRKSMNYSKYVTIL
jgi:hypothetical protein